jgi:hypothetical protein
VVWEHREQTVFKSRVFGSVVYRGLFKSEGT